MHQSQSFASVKKMTISLFKYHCALREERTIVSTYGVFSEDLLKEIFDTIGNESAVFPFRFIKRKKKLSNTHSTCYPLW